MANHHHHHHHEHHHPVAGNLQVAFWLNLAFTVLEWVGGWYTNSVAILSDALHDLGDSLALGVAWYLQSRSGRQADHRYTFGYQRFSLLGALINSIVLIAGSAFLVREAVERILHPESSHAPGMIFFAIIGVAVNGYAAWRLSHGKTLNERVVSWHLVEDVLGWVAVLIVAVVLLFHDIPYLDPALSLIITLYILYNVARRLRQTLHIFLQGAPADLNLAEIERRIVELEHVHSMHHTHIWSLEGEHHVFTTHIKLENINAFSQIVEVKRQVKDILRQYPFSHYTVETELDQETCALS